MKKTLISLALLLTFLSAKAQQLIAPQNLFVLSTQERALFTPPANWFPLQWTGYEGPSLQKLWEAFDQGLPPAPLSATVNAGAWYNLNGTGSENHALLWIGESALGNALAGNVAQFEIAAQNAIFLLDSMDKVQGHMRHEAIGLYVGFWEGGIASMALAGLYAPAGSTSGPQLLASARRWWADHIAVLRSLRTPDGQVMRLGARMNHGQPGGDDDENVKCAVNLQLIDPQPYNTLHPFISSRISASGTPQSLSSNGNPLMWYEPRSVAERWVVLRAFQAGALLRVPADQPTPSVVDEIYRWNSGNKTYVATPVVVGYPNCRWKVSWTAGSLVHIEVSDTGNTNGGKTGHPAPGWQAPLNIPSNARHILGAQSYLTPNPTCSQNNSCGNDAALMSIPKPYHNGCLTSFSPKVVVKNNGTTPITNLSVYFGIDALSLYSEFGGGAIQCRSFTLSPALAPGKATTLTLNPITTTTGAHTIKAWIMDVNTIIDVNATNDLYVETFTVVNSGVPIPYSEDFTNANPGALPADWSNYDGDAQESWFIFGGNGNKAAALSNFTYTGASLAKDEMTSPVLDLTGNPSAWLSFDYSHASQPNSTAFDSLQVQISTNCGTSFTTIWSKGGTALNTVPDQSTIFVPAGPQDYMNAQVNLSSYTNSSSVILKFVNWSNNGNSTLIDNINISVGQSTGINSVQNVYALNIYPVPANDLLNISCFTESVAKIQLVNAIGEVIHSQTLEKAGRQELDIDLSAFQSGIYQVILSGNNLLQSKKIAIVK